MATEQFANSAQTTLSAAITSTTATSISVVNGGPPFSSSAQFRILIDSELMLVTAGAGTNTWTVTRGIEGTTAATHSSGATVTEVLTAGGLENLDASYIGTGVLPIARGGTNSGTALNNNRIMESSGGAIVEAPALTNGQVLIGNTGNAPTAATLTAGSGVTITNGAGSITIASSASGVQNNYLLNGGMDFAQRQAPGTLTNVGTSDAYSADRWKVSWQTANVQYSRTDTAGASESGMEARYYGTWKQITAAGKFAIYQILEGVNSQPLAGQSLTFQCKMKASSAKTIRMAILQLGSAGTIDSIPNPLQTAWGANSTDPTWASNVTVAGSVSSKSVTTGWTLFSINVTPAATAKNLMVAVWTDSQFSANDTLSMTECQLIQGSSTQSWLPLPRAIELAACQRYYEKSWAVDTAPGTTWSAGLDQPEIMCGNSGNQYLGGTVPFHTTKRVSPTVKSYDSGGTSGKCSSLTYGGAWANGTTTTYFQAIGTDGLLVQVNVSSVTAVNFGFTADAEL
jgi:hypothetical protein